MSKANKENFLMAFIKYILPVIVVIAAVCVAAMMFMSKKKPAEKEVERIITSVDWIEIHAEDVALSVETQGVVAPRRSTLLISEVSGVVEWVSPALYAGGFFEKGELLLKIEPTDYVAAVANAKSLVAQMELRYQQELALSEQALQDWEEMGAGEPTELVLRKPQLAKAEADLEFAAASLKQAERNLEYTQVKAPYKGRVREKFVDIGQSVSPKVSQIASIYSVDAAEIRVSLAQEETGFVELPELYVDSDSTDKKPVAIVTTTYGGKTYEWEGYLDRTEGAIDATTRLVYAVVKVDNPYQSTGTEGQPPLKAGMFVNVEIQGRFVEDAKVIPRGGLNPGDLVYALDEDNRLLIRKVEVIKRGVNEVVVGEGLENGDRIVTTRLSAVSEGMLLDPVEQQAITEETQD